MLPNISALAYVNKAQEYKPGMAYMIEVFTTWCPPCRGMIPHLAELPTKYPNVYLVAVTEEEQDKVEAFSQKIPPMKKYNVACDAKGEVKALREAEAPNMGTPGAFLFDKDGKLVWHGVPSSPECDEWLGKLNSA
ncbi:Hypothetical protein GL50581_1609 [Giardia duodenalis ATCC 50581]|uniref:Thioredoxin domain-containing protein n=1 Tax=Giardia intestinalis (strain ATCC 50581 / GS clone H7) TaxID=598745 RepID=C6LS73_GIAIB|nr:Hypothetical protein GL50581_1609 [Giardia intestinalis ATCC 50581]